MSFRAIPKDPKVSGSPRATGSPRTEVGEIDTRAPFQSVKAAVSLFGAVEFSKAKPVIKKLKPSTEGALDKETQLLLSQNELNKLKEQLKSAETTKTRALTDLERAKRTLQDLTHKLESVSESKQSAIEATEAAKSQAKKLTVAKSRKEMGCGEAWKQDLNQAKEQYVASSAELGAAKQELTKIRQDFDAALDAKMVAFEGAADAQFAAKVDTEKLNELSMEIAAMQEAHSQVKLATEQAQQDLAKILAEKSICLQAHKTAMEEVEKKAVSLKNEYDPELDENLEEKLAKTTAEVEALQEEKKKAHASAMDSMRILTLELSDATKTLQQVAEEESTLRKLVDSLKLELENVKKDNIELKDKEAEAESVAGEMNVELQESNAELEDALAEEIKARDAFDEMISTFQQLSLEIENAIQETEEMTKNTGELKREAEIARIVVEEKEKKLPVVLTEVQDTKAAEIIALDEIKVLSKRTNDARASCSENLKLSTEEFESLNQKVKESENLAEMKVAAANAQVEAINASKNETAKRIEASLKEIKDVMAETEEALKKAEMAEAAMKAVEGELRRWRQQEQNKETEDASQFLEDTEVSPETFPQQL